MCALIGNIKLKTTKDKKWLHILYYGLMLPEKSTIDHGRDRYVDRYVLDINIAEKDGISHYTMHLFLKYSHHIYILRTR